MEENLSTQQEIGDRISLPPAILLMGPTASGKTAVALELAERFPVDIISVDSAQVFRDMNIGTAKPDRATLEHFPHRLIDLISPEESYSAARFCTDALAAMAEISAAGRIPLLVGGTMLYFKALLEGLADLPQADREVRTAIDLEANERGWPAMHAELAKLDPASAARLKPNDSQRLQRALEICRSTGRTMTELLAEQRANPPPYKFLKIGLLPSERSVLHQRIAQRFEAMLTAGLEDELRQLKEKYRLHADLPSMRSVGYRQAWEADTGLFARAELCDRGIFATRQLAKRQITWLTNTLQPETYDCLDPALHAHIVRRVASLFG
ncbi:MAG: tRNA isopentenyltransferase [Proteobacteria bacterium]|nr:tRNA isopentenyltransferase [Pseudomonadota bacterium]